MLSAAAPRHLPRSGACGADVRLPESSRLTVHSIQLSSRRTRRSVSRASDHDVADVVARDRATSQRGARLMACSSTLTPSVVRLKPPRNQRRPSTRHVAHAVVCPARRATPPLKFGYVNVRATF